MKVRRLPLADIVQLSRIVVIEFDEDENPTPLTQLPEGGTYGLDTQGRVWKLDEAVSEMFTLFTEDPAPTQERVRGRGKR